MKLHVTPTGDFRIPLPGKAFVEKGGSLHEDSEFIRWLERGGDVKVRTATKDDFVHVEPEPEPETASVQTPAASLVAAAPQAQAAAPADKPSALPAVSPNVGVKV